jgi:xanthine/uracil permease
MSERKDDRATGGQAPEEADGGLVAADDEEVAPVYVEAAKKVSRFSREFLATVIALLTTAFGVVVALAWNTALTKAVEESGLSEGDQVLSFFVYAIIITLLAVAVIVVLGRLASRVGAQPIQFTYPVKPAPPKD